MAQIPGAPDLQSLPPFNRKFYDSDQRISSIGSGSLGGKAQGLALLDDLISNNFPTEKFNQIQVNIHRFTVIRTNIFDAFMIRNDLYKIVDSGTSDQRLTHVFQMADLPFEVLGDLRSLIEEIHSPLAVRSSSLLEDATYEPFAGVYATKMIPNDQYDPRIRFNKLTEAIKFVFASTFFRAAKSYREATRHSHDDEKMAVIIQEVVGKRYFSRFYPELSGVARSYNFYPLGRAKHEDGVINLALGLGKTVVDGDVCWTYAPSYPRIGPPYASTKDLLNHSQRKFWAIGMGTTPAYHPDQEMEYMVKDDLSDAEKDGTLGYLASTYDVGSDRMVIGTHQNGPRVLNFAHLLVLRTIPFNETIRAVMALCQERMQSPVEIEFAMTFDPHRLGLLQVRPMVVSDDQVDLNIDELRGEDVFTASDSTLGNGIINSIQDIVYIIPDVFDKSHTVEIAKELESINDDLVAAHKPYLLVVFGRLGSSDPWLGIPVEWGQISGASVIVEAAIEGMNVEMSQGSHFFHNITSLGVNYFSIPITNPYPLDWDWLNVKPEVKSAPYTRHIRLEEPLQVKIDGRQGRGVIFKKRGADDHSEG